jgi:UDP-N-acetylmuramate dehydrogenase
MSWYRGFENRVREQVPLASRTTYRVGGPARYFAQPESAGELSALLARVVAENIPLRVLGGGTNLLVADRGVDGLVLRLPKKGFGFCAQDGARVIAGAAHSLPALVKWSAERGLSGLECLQGVPGTVGAALRMNAGGKYGEIGASVRRVRGFERDGSPFDFDAAGCGFVYRNSNLRGRIITECELALAPGDPAQLLPKLDEILREKCQSQPVAAHSAGCVFKNLKQDGVPPTGKLIDELGLKGARVGGAFVSTLHANFLVCENDATAADLARLIRLVRERALRERGLLLEMEVEVWGMDPEELLPAGWPKQPVENCRLAEIFQ